MANNAQLRGTPFSVTASGTTSAFAQFGKTANALYITDLTGSSSGSSGTWALMVGTTVYWQGGGSIVEDFFTHIVITQAGTVTFLMNGATATYANMAGYQI